MATLPFVRDSETSKDAAESIDSHTVAHDRGRIVEALRSHGALTDEEIQHRTGLAGNTERPRRVELVRMGIVTATAVKHRTSSGRWAMAWGLRT